MCKDVLKSHIHFVMFEELYYQGEPDRLEDFIKDDLVNDIKRFTRRVKFLNNPKLLEKISGNRNLLEISRNTIKPWYKLPLSLPADRRDGANEHLWEHITELLKVSGDYPE